MIEVRDLEFRFRSPGGSEPFSLIIPEMKVDRGEKVAVVGASGSGKSTLLHLLAGILRPARGHVRCGECVLSEASERERREFRSSHVGLVFQEFELIPYLDVLDNVLFPFFVHRRLELNPEVRERASFLLTVSGLSKKKGHRVDRLSHGERQRVAICRALLPRPRVILADEPTGNLDETTTQGVLSLFLTQVEEEDATLVLVTHDRLILDEFDRVVEMADLAK